MTNGGSLTNYEGLHGGSLSDYIGITAGHYKRCEVNDSSPYNFNTNGPRCIESGPNLFSLLDKSNISWTQWDESMPNPCGFIDVGTDWSYNVYTTHHNPAVYFTSVEGGRYSENFKRAPNPECVHRVLPMGSTAPNDTSAFDAALASGSVPKFNMVVPNDCENGHDLCGPQDQYRQFDDFLAREVPKILTSPAFGKDGLILITYDEWGDFTPHDKRVAFVAIAEATITTACCARSKSAMACAHTLAERRRRRQSRVFGGLAESSDDIPSRNRGITHVCARRMCDRFAAAVFDDTA